MTLRRPVEGSSSAKRPIPRGDPRPRQVSTRELFSSAAAGEMGAYLNVAMLTASTSTSPALLMPPLYTIMSVASASLGMAR